MPGERKSRAGRKAAGLFAAQQLDRGTSAKPRSALSQFGLSRHPVRAANRGFQDTPLNPLCSHFDSV